MIPTIIILFTFVSYALMPLFNQNITEDNIIHLIEKSANDTISFLSDDNSNEDIVESENVTSQSVQNTYAANGRPASTVNDNTGGDSASQESSDATSSNQPAQGESSDATPAPQPDIPIVPEPAISDDVGGNILQE